MIKIILFLSTLLSTYIVQGSEKVPKSPIVSQSKPNVLFILIDDLGWADIGCYGAKFHETPNVDRLAMQGMRFTDAYAASAVCSPTRASILTGKYPSRINFWRASPIENLPQSEITIAEALKDAGYHTAHMGKWHLMVKSKSEGESSFPEDHGFDVNVGGTRSGAPGTFFFPYKRKGREPGQDNAVPGFENGKEGDYLTDKLTDKAIAFMKETKDKPFFLNLWYFTVHTPVQGKEEKIAKYEKKLTELGITSPSGSVKEGKRYSRKAQDSPIYAAMVESMDENVGRILDYLKESGLEKNTIVIFSSDNGGLSTISSTKGGPACSFPLRAGKAWLHEGGIRVPMIIKWPGNPNPGSTCFIPVVSTDFYPTILEMAGLPLQPSQHLDGLSLVPLLKGKAKGLKREALYFHFPQDHHVSSKGPSAAIRMGDYKLVEEFYTGKLELYNLAQDLGEQNELSAQEPERTAMMAKMMCEWRAETKAYMPSEEKRAKDAKRKKAKAEERKNMNKGTAE
ncbi:sulfatase [Lentisphaera profundi]|uniref:Sulfatase n=1 Tax=Lentisphaera profundi TaxID=1658616 RepID=A0ABY7W515_9BACT|nr:sulfatase [Lentisphaera profundi]WDE99343.1 sulfatase [Lentisphaera profundi]